MDPPYCRGRIMREEYMERFFRFAQVSLLLCFCLCVWSLPAAAGQIKMSVFTFSTASLEASGYGTTVANMLMNSLKAEPELDVLDRKELEAFLALNELQQDENLENVVQIGTRLGLNAVVTGTVEKKGPLILVNCKVVQVEKKRIIVGTQVRSLGDAGLGREMTQLAAAIRTAVVGAAAKPAETDSGMKGPVNLRKRAGNLKVYLSWDDAPGGAAHGYEVFRALAEAGPFTRLAQVTKPEYLDQTVERNRKYYYKIRSFGAGGQQSGFSEIITAESALTPNPPIILKTERHIKSIQLTWAPAPIASEDPLKLAGYKLYRAETEQGPYREAAMISFVPQSAGTDAAAADTSVKVTYADKGLPDGKDYYYRLTAYNEKDLESEFSLPVKGSTVPSVGGLKAQGGMIREVRLEWNAIECPSLKGYAVYRSTAENEGYARIKRVDVPDAGKSVRFEDRDGLGDNVRYFYRVTGVEDPEAETSPSATVHAVTRGKPPTPQNVKAKSGLVKRVELEWTALSADEVEGYKVYRRGAKDDKPALLRKIEGRAESRFTDDLRSSAKPADNAAYSYHVTSYNKVDVESEPSERVSASTKPLPSKPAGVKGVDLRVNEVPLSWQANPETDIVAYHVYRCAEGTDFSPVAKVQNGTGCTDKSLKEGRTYRYRLQAEDRDGLLSEFSETIAVKTKPKPGAPAGLSGSFSDGKVALEWRPGAEPDIAHYTVYEKRFFGPEKIATVNEARYSDPGVAAGKSKTYVVTATDRDGLESDFSPEVSVTAGK